MEKLVVSFEKEIEMLWCNLKRVPKHWFVRIMVHRYEKTTELVLGVVDIMQCSFPRAMV